MGVQNREIAHRQDDQDSCQVQRLAEHLIPD